jgi:hypothetical protein
VRVTAPSACPWLAHPVSGLFLVTARPVQTRFRCAYTLRLKLATKINSLTHYTKGTPSQHLATEVTKTAPTVCRHPVSGSLSLPALGCFSPFPHGTGSLSVTEEYLGLEGGPPMFRQGFTCPALLEDPDLLLPVRGCHPLWRAFPDASGSQSPGHWPGPRSLVTTDGVSVDVLSSGYLDISVRRVRLLPLWIHDKIPPKGWVAPFGDLGITGRSPLPRAFRSVPRPSSPLGAKASTRCPSRARPRPAPRPRCARPENRDQRTEIRPTGLSGLAFCPLEPCVGSPLPGQRAPAYLHTHARARPIDRARPQGQGGRSCHARFTVTTRFTMSKRLAAHTTPLGAARADLLSGRLQEDAVLLDRTHACWWAWADSNGRPHAYQACALTS